MAVGLQTCRWEEVKRGDKKKKNNTQWLSLPFSFLPFFSSSCFFQQRYLLFPSLFAITQQLIDCWLIGCVLRPVVTFACDPRCLDLIISCICCQYCRKAPLYWLLLVYIATAACFFVYYSLACCIASFCCSCQPKGRVRTAIAKRHSSQQQRHFREAEPLSLRRSSAPAFVRLLVWVEFSSCG